MFDCQIFYRNFISNYFKLGNIRVFFNKNKNFGELASDILFISDLKNVDVDLNGLHIFENVMIIGKFVNWNMPERIKMFFFGAIDKCKKNGFNLLRGKNVLIDCGSPNPTGDAHMGNVSISIMANLRKNILLNLGAKAHLIYTISDIGGQMQEFYRDVRRVMFGFDFSKYDVNEMLVEIDKNHTKSR